jgi:hypothetical protein
MLADQIVGEAEQDAKARADLNFCPRCGSGRFSERIIETTAN